MLIGAARSDAPATGHRIAVGIVFGELLEASGADLVLYPFEDAAAAAVEHIVTLDPEGRGAGRDRTGGRTIVKTIIAARDKKCALIVVSTHARRGFRRRILGSASSALIRRGACDLLMVPRAASTGATDHRSF